MTRTHLCSRRRRRWRRPYFAYGGISIQVGGEVAEVQGNEDWQAGWIHHDGVPLGNTSIDWQGLGMTTNYRIAGGPQASLPDYARVLAMLLGGGVGNGRRILSESAIQRRVVSARGNL